MNRMINQAYLLIGGNMGDRLVLLAQARETIAQSCGVITRMSAVYETAAWGKTDQPSFLNQVLELNTSLDAHQLLQTVLVIEQQMGRQRTEKYAPRLMDIDILLFNNEVINTATLQVPHPHMAVRRFVLKPLSELVPDYLHPITKITITRMLENCTDHLKVYKL